MSLAHLPLRLLHALDFWGDGRVDVWPNVLGGGGMLDFILQLSGRFLICTALQPLWVEAGQRRYICFELDNIAILQS
jgi:hypothetical protein